MITAEEQKSILTRAYVPEHSVELFTRVSRGEPFLFEDYFCCQTQYGIIVVGYPLEHEFDLGRFEAILKQMIKVFRPALVSLIAPQTPVSFAPAVTERFSDRYYVLNLPADTPRGNLVRMVNKAREAGTVEHGAALTPAHRELAEEFLERTVPPPRIRELLLRMWDYVGRARDGKVLNVWDRHGRLAAFFVADFAPNDFTTYVIGCYSKKNYLSGASDLLMSELIKISAGLDKRFIHLGIGANQGIRAFKEKWGGIASKPYELCELILKKPSVADIFLGAIARR